MNALTARLRTEAAADPPIAEIPCSSTRCRPLPEAWIAAARRNRARWRFCITARPASTLWKMPTTKTRSPFFRQNLIPNLTGYSQLGTSTPVFALAALNCPKLGLHNRLSAVLPTSLLRRLINRLMVKRSGTRSTAFGYVRRFLPLDCGSAEFGHPTDVYDAFGQKQADTRC